jgi:Carboxypeptidase regulatory-like domain
MEVRTLALAAVLTASALAACGPAPSLPPPPAPTPPVLADRCTSGGDADPIGERRYDVKVIRDANGRVVRREDAEISGRIVDGNGEPAAGLEVRFERPDFWWRVRTDGDGRFRYFTSAGAGEYDVDVYVPDARGGSRLHLGHARPSEKGLAYSVPWVPSVISHGTLTDDAGSPLAGWRVVAHDDASPPVARSSADTDARGRFRLVAWSGFRATLALRTPKGRRRLIERRADIPGEPGQHFVAVHPGIDGTVRSFEDDSLLAGAVVTAIGRTGTHETRSDAEGRFAFAGLDPDTEFELSASGTGFELLRRVARPGDESNVTLVLVETARRIRGSARRADGKPLATRWIRFVPLDPDEPCVQTLTDLDGTFVVRGASRGESDAHLLAPGPDGRLVPGPKLGRVRGGDDRSALVLDR